MFSIFFKPWSFSKKYSMTFALSHTPQRLIAAKWDKRYSSLILTSAHYLPLLSDLILLGRNKKSPCVVDKRF